MLCTGSFILNGIVNLIHEKWLDHIQTSRAGLVFFSMCQTGNWFCTITRISFEETVLLPNSKDLLNCITQKECLLDDLLNALLKLLNKESYLRIIKSDNRETATRYFMVT